MKINYYNKISIRLKIQIKILVNPRKNKKILIKSYNLFEDTLQMIYSEKILCQ